MRKFIEQIVLTILIIPFFGIAGVEQFLGDTLYKLYQVSSATILLFFILFIMKKKNVEISIFLVSFITYQALSLTVTLIQRDFSFGFIYNFIAQIVMCMIILYDGKRMLNVIAISMSIIVLINFVTMFINGFEENVIYFIGGKNKLPMFLIPAMSLVLLSSRERYNKKSFFSILIAIICLLSIFLGKSGTGIIIVFITIFLFSTSKFIVKKTPFLLFIISLNIVMILFSDTIISSKIWQDIMAILGKTSTLTGRTEIWKEALNIFKNNFIFGFGRGAIISFQTSLGTIQTVEEAHNIILELLVSTGLIGFGLYSVYFYSALYRLNLKNKSHKIIFITIIILLINGLTESINNLMFLGMFFAFSYSLSKMNNRVEVLNGDAKNEI